MKFKATISAIALAGILSAAPAAAQGLNEETVIDLGRKVQELQASLAASNQLVEDARPQIEQQQYIIDNAPQVTQQMIDDLGTLIDAFNTKSAYFQTIQQARTDIKEKIDIYREGSEAQKKAAEILRGTLAEFDEIDARRDDLVGRAIAERRRLENHREDLEAFVIVGAYAEMAQLFTSMLDQFEETVTTAEEVNTDLGKVSGFDVQ